MSVAMTRDQSLTFGDERPLPIENFTLVAAVRNYDVAADGRRFLVAFPAEQADASEPDRPGIIIVDNWFEELRRLVPVN